MRHSLRALIFICAGYSQARTVPDGASLRGNVPVMSFRLPGYNAGPVAPRASDLILQRESGHELTRRRNLGKGELIEGAKA